MDLTSVIVLAVIVILFFIGLRRILRNLLSKSGGCSCGSADCSCGAKEHEEQSFSRIKLHEGKEGKGTCPYCSHEK